MIGPILAVKLGEKGPPFVKGWQELTPDNLEKQCAIYDFANQGLRLDNYIALDPDDQAASDLLDAMDRDGKLPNTVSWQTWRGMTIRLYKRQDGLSPIKPTHSPKLEIRTGNGQYVLIPPSKHKTGQYSWLPDRSPEAIEVADLPAAALSSILDVYKHLKTTVHTSASSMPISPEWIELWRGVSAGSLHDATIKLAGRLLGRGLPEEEVIEILTLWNTRNNPPSDENMLIKRVRGIDRAEIKKQHEGKRRITEEIREWVLTSSGLFLTSDVHKELDLTSRDLKKQANEAVRRMESDGIVARCGKKRGCYRLIEGESPSIDIESADISTTYPIKWPFDLQNYVNLYPKSIVIVAGAPNAGKTAFMLNTVRLNMGTHKIYYFSSEMGPEEFKLRLLKFDDLRIRDWKFFPKQRSSNFADAIVPNAVNIIDYLEITDDFFKVGGEIKDIYDRLEKGIAIIAMQKKTGSKDARGGEFTREKARLYISMDSGILEITKAKLWANNEINPNGLTVKFKLVGGAKFIEVGGSLYDLM